jgi:hypothetical protein
MQIFSVFVNNIFQRGCRDTCRKRVGGLALVLAFSVSILAFFLFDF